MRKCVSYLTFSGSSGQDKLRNITFLLLGSKTCPWQVIKVRKNMTTFWRNILPRKFDPYALPYHHHGHQMTCPPHESLSPCGPITYQTFVSHQCNLRFRVYRYHCGFSKLFPDNSLGRMSLHLWETKVWQILEKPWVISEKSSPLRESECLRIFRRQTLGFAFEYKSWWFIKVCGCFKSE